MLQVSITTPEGTIFKGKADAVTLPTAAGEITVLPGHIPLVGIVLPGTVMLKSGADTHFLAVSRGVIEVDGKSMRILVDSADRVDELEEAAIQRAKDQAVALQKEKRQDAEGFAEATAILERELARLKTIRRHRSYKGLPPSQNS